MLRFILINLLVFVTTRATIWEHFPFHQHHFKQNHPKFEQRNSKAIENDYSVCRTKGCFRIASEFWESMNKSADPCDDFYEYACGNWAKNNPIPPTEMEWDTINKMTQEVKYKIRDFLEEDEDPDDLLPVKQVKKFYKSCMNVDELEIMGLKPLEAILSRHGGWPLIMESGEWFEEILSWQQIDDHYSRLTKSSFYTFDIRKDTTNVETFGDLKRQKSSIIELKKPELPPVVTLSHGVEFDRKKMYDDASYAKFIKEIAYAFIEERNAHVSEEDLDEDIENLIEFEKKLGLDNEDSDILPTSLNLQSLSKVYNFQKISDSSHSQMNWTRVFSNLFSEVNIEIKGKEQIFLDSPSAAYLENLRRILDETKARTIVNYIHWNFLSQMLPYTTSKMRELYYEFKKHLTGVKTEKPRWETCVSGIKMQHAVSYHFVKKYFKENMKEEAIKIFKNIQKIMIKRILKCDWISENMKKVEIDKITSMGTIIGYPNWYDNDTAFLNYYRGMPIGYQYLDNVLMFKKYSLKKRLRNLENPEMDVEWFPTLVNAAYNRLYNELIFPSGVIQYPFYSAAQPETVNFGGIGTIMGHEVAHAFDRKGLLFDKNGNYAFWPDEEESKIKNETYCFMSQYGKFYQMENEESLIAARQQTVGEDMADSLGLSVVFEAVEEIEKEKNEPRLPGFEELSNQQMFFLSFAKVWCTSATPEYEELVKEEDVHSKPYYRVIAAVQNSEGFSKAFNCPEGSRMNPKEKCKLW